MIVSLRTWRKLLVPLLAGLFIQCTSPVQVGQPAPEFSLAGLDGHRAVLNDLGGKVVVLHFWATWCPPCLEELPELAGFHKRLKNNGVVLLPVCVDSTGPENIRRFLDSWGFDLPVYLDPGARLAHKYGTFRYPETYVLDAQGVVRRKIVGPGDWSSPSWAQFLQKYSKCREMPNPSRSPGNRFFVRNS